MKPVLTLLYLPECLIVTALTFTTSWLPQMLDSCTHNHVKMWYRNTNTTEVIVGSGQRASKSGTPKNSSFMQPYGIWPEFNSGGDEHSYTLYVTDPAASCVYMVTHTVQKELFSFLLYRNSEVSQGF